MKQIFLSLITIFALLACSSDNNNANEEPIQQIVLQPPFGTWENGNYFITWDNGFYAAYLGDGMLECGSFEYNDANSCFSCGYSYNNYHSYSTYQVNSYNEKTLTITAEYTDVFRTSRNKTLTLTKSTQDAIKFSPLYGKSYTYNDNGQTITIDFETFNTASKSTTSEDARRYPITLLYLFRNGRIYFQQFKTNQVQPTIGGWNSEADTGNVIVWEMTFDSNGNVSNHKDITASAI